MNDWNLGTWYWRYRVAGKSWSATSFLALPTWLCLWFHLSGDFLAKVPKAYPRVLLNDPRQLIQNLVKKADALAIIAEANKALKERILTEKDAQPAAVSGNEKQDKKIMADAVVALGTMRIKWLRLYAKLTALTGCGRPMPKKP
ncbi:MAG: hypothetical protein R2822_10305 [Spirosomataceae bacterium]